jgi:16S rRNA (guanine(527)-N(7))-methyltransferase RsmG
VLREELNRLIGGLSESEVDQMVAHFDLLRRWNSKLNLTRIDSEEEAAKRHYGESVFLARRLPAGRLRIADVGSGAGFPGIPISIVRPECSVTLIESHKRKAVFLREATRQMANVQVSNTRGAELSDSFDWVVARAVAWEELKLFVFRLAPRVAFLGGEVEIPRSMREALPWGDRRFLTFVSRET